MAAAVVDSNCELGSWCQNHLLMLFHTSLKVRFMVIWGTMMCVCVCVLAWAGQGRSVADPWLSGPTILCAGSQQINDVLVLPNDLHHLHLRNQVWQVFLCGVSWRGREINHIRAISRCSVRGTGPKCLIIITLQGIHINIAALMELGWSLSW